MKLLAAKTATTATELSLGKATCVAVYASAISIISVVEMMELKEEQVEQFKVPLLCLQLQLQ